VVKPNDQVTVMTASGIVLRTAVSGISRLGRSTRGVRIVNLQEGDSVAALAVITYEDMNREVDGGSRDDDGFVDKVSIEDSVPGDAEVHDDLLDAELDLEDDVEEEELDDGELDGDDFDDSMDDGEAALAMEGEDEE
jgi:DNA gyrase subunit A